jgi:hypothetical protein
MHLRVMASIGMASTKSHKDKLSNSKVDWRDIEVDRHHSDCISLLSFFFFLESKESMLKIRKS